MTELQIRAENPEVKIRQVPAAYRKKQSMVERKTEELKSRASDPSQSEVDPVKKFFLKLFGRTECECGRHRWGIYSNHARETMKCFPSIRRCSRPGCTAAEIFWAYSIIGKEPSGDPKLGDNKWYPLLDPTYGMNEEELLAWKQENCIINPEETKRVRE